MNVLLFVAGPLVVPDIPAARLHNETVQEGSQLLSVLLCGSIGLAHPSVPSGFPNSTVKGVGNKQNWSERFPGAGVTIYCASDSAGFSRWRCVQYKFTYALTYWLLSSPDVKNVRRMVHILCKLARHKHDLTLFVTNACSIHSKLVQARFTPAIKISKCSMRETQWMAAQYVGTRLTYLYLFWDRSVSLLGVNIRLFPVVVLP